MGGDAGAAAARRQEGQWAVTAAGRLSPAGARGEKREETPMLLLLEESREKKASLKEAPEATTRTCTRSDSRCNRPRKETQKADRADGFRKDAQDKPKQASISNFRPLQTYFEEEAATSATSVMNPWKALVEGKF